MYFYVCIIVNRCLSIATTAEISVSWHFFCAAFYRRTIEDKRERFHRKISLTNVCANALDVNHPRVQQHHSNG